jgi:quinol monooxygenase YgiN
MITRIVKMHFSEAFIDEFKMLFKATQPHILAFEGCTSVRLLQEEGNPNVFFTISEWQSTEKLNHYRHAELFLKTWAIVKPNFISKAEAWSLVSSFQLAVGS